MGLFNLFKKQIKEPEWISRLPKEYVELILSEIKSNPQACNLDELPQGIGKFGLVSTNPIPVYGIPSNEIYLKKLLFKNGERFRWRRVGSMNENIIEKPIDEYELFDLQGDRICFLYISPYHWKTSMKAPEGFKIIR